MSTGGSHLDSDLDSVLIGGREPVTIRVVDYDQAWPERFAAKRARSRARANAGGDHHEVRQR